MRIGLGIGLNNTLFKEGGGGGNVAPSNVTAPVISGSTSLGSVLTTTNGTWSGTPATFSYTYQWKRNGSPIVGATASTYTTVLADSTANITCDVTADNGVAPTATAGSNTLTMANYTPANTVPPAVTGTSVVGQTLSTTNGTWTNSPSTYSYQWYRGVTLISGATNSTYTLVQADAGNTSNIKCVVTATNSAGTASADSNTIAQILTVRTNSFLTASAISDAIISGALNTFDIGLISNSLDTDLFAVHPCVGGSASTIKWNFMNATDSDSAHRLLFNGSWAYSANGMTGNGTNTSATTFVNPTTKYTTTNGFFGCVIGNTVATNGYDIGFGAGFGLALYTGAAYFMYGGGFTLVNRTNVAGFYCVNKNGSNVEGYFNGTRLLNNSITNTLPSLNGAIGSTGTGTTFSSNNYRFVVHGINMNQAKISALYTLITSFNSELGR